MSEASSRRSATGRFSGRVRDYVRYRPGYPEDLIAVLRDEGIPNGAVIADVGSGTGISSELLLRHGYRVFGVEPNDEMRHAAERMLQSHPLFRSIAAPAEQTTLPSGSAEAVLAAQAFHWFDRERARTEFCRILKPGGLVVLVWNERRVDTSPFLAAYEDLLLRFGTDYRKVDHRRIGDQDMKSFFRSHRKHLLYNEQQLDRQGLIGRLLSSSYVPGAGEPGYEEMLSAVEALFEQHAVKGRVRIEYDTVVYAGAPDCS